MKTFKFVGMALIAIFMCVGFTSCNKDDDPFGGNDGGNDVNSRKLTKIVSEIETYTFSYDNEGRLTNASIIEDDGEYRSDEKYEFIWGNDVIKVKRDSESYTLSLSDGLVQYGDDKTYYYNNSKQFVKGVGYATTEVIWDGDKMVNIESKEPNEPTWEVTLTYGKTCNKGYFPFIPYFIDFGCEVLFMAHPEIAGMRTNQLPETYKTEDGTITLSYTYDKEGYVSKMLGKRGNQSVTYTFTWE